jgi:hypothetical protein
MGAEYTPGISRTHSTLPDPPPPPTLRPKPTNCFLLFRTHPFSLSDPTASSRDTGSEGLAELRDAILLDSERLSNLAEHSNVIARNSQAIAVEIDE